MSPLQLYADSYLAAQGRTPSQRWIGILSTIDESKFRDCILGKRRLPNDIDDKMVLLKVRGKLMQQHSPTHCTPRIRKDIVQELYQDLSCLSVNSEHLVFEIRRLSALRDQEEADPGQFLRDIVNRYVERVLGKPTPVSDLMAGIIMRKLIAGQEFDLAAWIEAEAQMERDYGGPDLEIIAFAAKVYRRDPEGRTSTLTIQQQFQDRTGFAIKTPAGAGVLDKE